MAPRCVCMSPTTFQCMGRSPHVFYVAWMHMRKVKMQIHGAVTEQRYHAVFVMSTWAPKFKLVSAVPAIPSGVETEFSRMALRHIPIRLAYSVVVNQMTRAPTFRNYRVLSIPQHKMLSLLQLPWEDILHYIIVCHQCNTLRMTFGKARIPRKKKNGIRNSTRRLVKECWRTRRSYLCEMKKEFRHHQRNEPGAHENSPKGQMKKVELCADLKGLKTPKRRY